MDPRYLFILITHYLFTFLFIRIFFYISPGFLTDLVNDVVSLISAFLVGWITFRFSKSKWLGEEVSTDLKAVLITGCDSGFGHALAIRLDAKGFHVFASCLFPDGPGAKELKNRCSERLQVLGLDVTSDRSVKDAVEFVKQNLGTSELWAVVNNAGILKGNSIELSRFQDFESCIDVNVYGHIRVNKAFLPLLKQTQGRVVNVTSLVGRTAMPFFTPYAVSKFAAVGLSDCLRQEMDVWGVKVISIEPESFTTGIAEDLKNNFQATLAELDEFVKSDYGEDYIDELKRVSEAFALLGSPKIQVVVDDLESAVSLKYPEPVYGPRRNVLFRIFLFAFTIFPIVVQSVLLKISFVILKLKNPKS